MGGGPLLGAAERENGGANLAHGQFQPGLDGPKGNSRPGGNLALAEAATRIADRPDAVSDEIWNEAKRHYDEQALAALIIEIGLINIWNRFNVVVRQIAGAIPK